MTYIQDFTAIFDRLQRPTEISKSMLKVEKTRSRKHDKVTVVSFDVFGILNLTDYPKLNIKKAGEEISVVANNKRSKKLKAKLSSVNELIDALPFESLELRSAVLNGIIEQGIESIEDLSKLSQE